jgi:DNA-binding NarL/FixJ family response regulator
MPMKVMIADDHPFYRMGIAAGLKDHENIEIVYAAEDGVEVIDWLRADKPVDLLILDLNMPRMSGYDVLEKIKEHSYPVKTIVISMEAPDKIIKKIIEMGAHGYVNKTDEPEEMYKAIQGVMNNGSYFTKSAHAVLINSILHKNTTPAFNEEKILFTPREIKIIDCISREMTNDEIAKELYISVRTVEGIRSELIQRVGAKNAIGLVLFAQKSITLTA